MPFDSAWALAVTPHSSFCPLVSWNYSFLTSLSAYFLNIRILCTAGKQRLNHVGAFRRAISHIAKRISRGKLGYMGVYVQLGWHTMYDAVSSQGSFRLSSQRMDGLTHQHHCYYEPLEAPVFPVPPTPS